MRRRRKGSVDEYKMQADSLKVQLQSVLEENVLLREKINDMIQVMKRAAEADDSAEGNSKLIVASLQKENEGLRALLGLRSDEPVPVSPS